MLSLVAIINSLFRQRTYQNELEQYIISKNPQTTYDVEMLTREYDRKLVEQSLSYGPYNR